MGSMASEKLDSQAPETLETAPVSEATQAAPADAPLADADAFLADMKRSSGTGEEPESEPEPEGQSEAEREDAETPEPPSEDEALAQLPEELRELYVRKMEELREREQSLVEREAQASASEGAPSQDSQPPAPQPATAYEFVQSIKEELERQWEEVDAPGEKLLVGVLETMARELDQVRAFVQRQEAEVREQEARAMVAAAEEASKMLESEYGLKLDPKQVMGHVQAGAQAYALLQGLKGVQDLEATPETFAAIVKMRELATVERLLRERGSKAKASPTNPARGSGGASGAQPATPEDQFVHDLREARKRAGLEA